MDLHIELNIEREEAEVLPYENITDPKFVEVPETPGMLHARFADPVSLIVAVGVAVIADRIVDHWLTSREQGVMIDFRGDPPCVSRVAGVPAGVVFIIEADGTRKDLRYDYDKRSVMKDAITAVFKKRDEG